MFNSKWCKCPPVIYFLNHPANSSLFKNSITNTIFLAFLIFTLISGSPVHAQNDKNQGMNLHLAVLQGNTDQVKHLIEAGANLNEKDQFGSTPLLIAATFGRTEIARIIIDAGADLNIASNEGSTALHVASFLCREEIVKALLKNGANRYIKNNYGSTAYDIVSVPFDIDKDIYQQLGSNLKPLGLELDFERLKETRPVIAELLRPEPEKLTDVNYTSVPGGDWKTSTPSEQGVDPALVAELYLDASMMEKLRGLLVIKNGYLIAEGYFNGGAIDKKTRLQSVTKSYTSALVGKALEQGYLSDLDQKMIEFFPELADKIVDKRKEQITLRDMLEMRAGYPWEELTKEHFDILYKGFKPGLLIDLPLTLDPGTGFQYSNLTSHLLGIIIARASGKDLRTFAQENLFQPLNTEAGDWIRDWEGYYNGHADLNLTARDMAKFGLLYLNDGKYGGKQVIPAEWIRESLQNYSRDAWITKDRINYVGRYFRELGYGYQWWSASVNDYRFDFAWGHGGQMIVLLDKYDMVIVVKTYPFYKQHDDEAWKYEKENFNLIGKFIQLLTKES